MKKIPELFLRSPRLLFEILLNQKKKERHFNTIIHEQQIILKFWPQWAWKWPLNLSCIKNGPVNFKILIKLQSEMNRTKESHKILLMKSSGNHFIFLPVFYLITWVMKALKNFGKIGILKLWELIYLGEVKTHFGKLALKWCIFRHEKKYLNWYYVIALNPIRI